MTSKSTDSSAGYRPPQSQTASTYSVLPPSSPEEYLSFHPEAECPILSPEELAVEDFRNFLDHVPWDGDSKNHNKSHWAFKQAVKRAIDPDVAMDLVADRIRRMGGTIDYSDLCEQYRRAVELVGQVANGMVFPPRPPAVEFSPDLLRQVASRVAVPDPADFLRRRSPVSPSTVRPNEFLERLYRPGEKVIVFTEYKSQGQAIYEVGHRNAQIPTAGLDGVWYLVQPVDGQEHMNPRQNKMSRRSEESVTRWPYLVIESDKADAQSWMRFLLQLPLPVVAIYTSGGRSIHALVRVDAADKAEWDQIKNKLVTSLVRVGADRGALSAVRLSRLPQCLRRDMLQELLYLDPNADGTPILTQTQPKEVK